MYAVNRVDCRDVDVAGDRNSPLRRQGNIRIGHGEAALCVDSLVLEADKPAGENITGLGGNVCRGVDCFAFCILCTCKRRRTAVQIIADGMLGRLSELRGIGNVAGNNAQCRSPALEGINSIVCRCLDRVCMGGHLAVFIGLRLGRAVDDPRYGVSVDCFGVGRVVFRVAGDRYELRRPALEGVAVLCVAFQRRLTAELRDSAVFDLLALEQRAVRIVELDGIRADSSFKLCGIRHIFGNRRNFGIPTDKGVGRFGGCFLGGLCTDILGRASDLNGILGQNRAVVVLPCDGVGILFPHCVHLDVGSGDFEAALCRINRALANAGLPADEGIAVLRLRCGLEGNVAACNTLLLADQAAVNIELNRIFGRVLLPDGRQNDIRVRHGEGVALLELLALVARTPVEEGLAVLRGVVSCDGYRAADFEGFGGAGHIAVLISNGAGFDFFKLRSQNNVACGHVEGIALVHDCAGGGKQPAGEGVAVLRRVFDRDGVHFICLFAVCNLRERAVHAGRDGVCRFFRLPLSGQGHIGARHLEGFVCLIDSAAKAGAPACEDEAFLGEGLIRNGDERVCDILRSGRSRAYAAVQVIGDGILGGVSLPDSGHLDCGSRNLKTAVCRVDLAFADAGLPADKGEAVLGLCGHQCDEAARNTSLLTNEAAVDKELDRVFGRILLPLGGQGDVGIRHDEGVAPLIDPALMAGTPAGEGVASARRVRTLDLDDAADFMLDACIGQVFVLIGNIVLDSRDDLFPDSRQGNVSRGHLELVAWLIDSAADVGLPALEGLAIHCGRSFLDGDPGADLGLNCVCGAVANGVNIGQVSLCRRDDLLPDCRQGDVGVGHDELLAGFKGFAQTVNVASPAHEGIAFDIGRCIRNGHFGEDIDIRSRRSRTLCADVGQSLGHVLPLRVERNPFAVCDGLIREVSFVSIGIAAAVGRGVPAAEFIKLRVLLKSVVIHRIRADELVGVQALLLIVGKYLIFHHTGDSLVSGVGVKDHSIFDGLPLDAVIRVVFRHVCSPIKCIAVCIEPLDEAIAFAGGRGNLHIVGDLRGVVLVLHLGVIDLHARLIIAERQNDAVRHLAHIVRAFLDRLCRPDVLLLRACVGACFRLCYFESPLDRILAPHVVSARAVREALVVASICASFSKLIHLERSNVAAANGLSTAVLLLYNRHNVIWVHER